MSVHFVFRYIIVNCLVGLADSVNHLQTGELGFDSRVGQNIVIEFICLQKCLITIRSLEVGVSISMPRKARKAVGPGPDLFLYLSIAFSSDYKSDGIENKPVFVHIFVQNNFSSKSARKIGHRTYIGGIIL